MCVCVYAYTHIYSICLYFCMFTYISQKLNYILFLFLTCFFFFFPFIFISWRLIALQYCSGFCHTLTWISHGFTFNLLFHVVIYIYTMATVHRVAKSQTRLKQLSAHHTHTHTHNITLIISFNDFMCIFQLVFYDWIFRLFVNFLLFTLKVSFH